MSEIAHNHPPRCCCITSAEQPAAVNPGGTIACPLCPEHGELAQLAEPQPGECPVCHSEIGKQHTDYCRFFGIVSPITASLPIEVITDATLRSATPDGRLSLTDLHTQTAAETCPDREQHALTTYCGTCHTTFSAAGPSDLRTQTSTPTTQARTELDRATLDATLTGNGYLLNGRRIPPEDVTVVHREPTPTTQDTPCPCTYSTGPVQHTPTCPEWHPTQ